MGWAALHLSVVLSKQGDVIVAYQLGVWDAVSWGRSIKTYDMVASRVPRCNGWSQHNIYNSISLHFTSHLRRLTDSRNATHAWL